MRERVAQADCSKRLAFAGGRWAQSGHKNELSVGGALKALTVLEGNFGLKVPVRFETVRRYSETLLCHIRNLLHSGCLGYLNIRPDQAFGERPNEDRVHKHPVSSGYRAR